jgi:hypothetical protein
MEGESGLQVTSSSQHASQGSAYIWMRGLLVATLRALALEKFLTTTADLACGWRWAVRHSVDAMDTVASLVTVELVLTLLAGLGMWGGSVLLAHLAAPLPRRLSWLLTAGLTCLVLVFGYAERTQSLVHGTCEAGAPVLRGPAAVAMAPYGDEPAYTANITAQGVRDTALHQDQWWLVGDSFVFGAGLASDQTIAAQLTRISGDQVANMGVLGDNVMGIAKRLARWHTLYRPKGVWILLVGNDGDVPVPWLDCDLPLLCRTRHWSAGNALAPQPWLKGQVTGNQATLAAARNQLRQVVGELRSRGIFVGVLLYGAPSPGLRAVVDDLAVDAFDVASCQSKDLLFGGNQHFNAKGAACAAEALLALRSSDPNLLRNVRVDAMPAARCRRDDARALAQRLVTDSQWQARWSPLDPCLLQLRPQIEDRTVEVDVKLGATGPSYVPLPGGVVELPQQAPISDTAHQWLRSHLGPQSP